MWNTPTKDRLAQIPKLYETEHIPLQEKLIHLHFFLGGNDWFIVEHDGGDLLWGFVVLNGDLQMSEWGYISFSDLKDINIGGLEIDCEIAEYWKVRSANEVELICKAQRWQYNPKKQSEEAINAASPVPDPEGDLGIDEASTEVQPSIRNYI